MVLWHHLLEQRLTLVRRLCTCLSRLAMFLRSAPECDQRGYYKHQRLRETLSTSWLHADSHCSGSLGFLAWPPAERTLIELAERSLVLGNLSRIWGKVGLQSTSRRIRYTVGRLTENVILRITAVGGEKILLPWKSQCSGPASHQFILRHFLTSQASASEVT